MRRFDVYFLQKRGVAGWETLERAQSASVLISSMVREFDGEEDAELRVVAGDWNEAIGEWEFSQIFFVDRGSIDLQLSETRDDEALSSWNERPQQEHEPEYDSEIAATAETEPTPVTEAEPASGDAGGDSDFASAIRAASEEADREAERASTGFDHRGDAEDDLDAPEPTDRSVTSRRFAPDDTNEDLRSLGFAQANLGSDEPDGPPPQFRPEPRRRGRAFFMAGTLLIALILIVGAALALMVAFKVDPAPRYIEMFQEWRTGAEMTDSSGDAGDTLPVMPQTAGQVARHDGVVPDLRGRWSAGDCSSEYIEFDVDGFVVAAQGRSPSVEVPVVETLIDDYTWYLRRSDTLVEHFQRLSNDEIQMIGDTTPVGFTQRTSEVFSRCR